MILHRSPSQGSGLHEMWATVNFKEPRQAPPGITELQTTAASFSPEDFRRVFFVVHSPEHDLAAAADIPEYVEVVPPERLGELAMHAGLAGWLKDKVS